MSSSKLGLALAALLVSLAVAGGCGSSEPNFAPTPGSAPPDAPKTPQEVDARSKTDL